MSVPNLDSRYTTPNQVDAKISAQAAADTVAYSPTMPARLPRPKYRVIATCSTGGSWLLYAPTLLASSTSYADGAITASCVQISGTGSPIQFTLTLTSATDFTAASPVVWVKAASAANVSAIEVYLTSDGTWTNFVKAAWLNSSGVNSILVHDGVWVPLSFPWSAFGQTGTATNRAAITKVRVNVNLITPANGNEIRVGGIGSMPEPSTTYPNGVISFSFDDDLTASQVAYDRMGLYGFPGTLFSYGAIHFDQPGYMTLAQARTLRDTLGWEIGAHAHDSASHVDQSSLTSAKRLSDYSIEKAWLQQAGFASDLYAWPNSTSDEASEIDARKFFHAARGGGGGTAAQAIETIPAAKPMFLRAMTTDQSYITLANMTQLVDFAKSAHAWGIFVIHDITTAGTGPRTISTANWNALVDYVNTSGVAVRTISDVLRTPAT